MSLVEETAPPRRVISEVPPTSPAGSLRQNRDFWRLWGGQAVSSVGSQVSGLALPLLILALTYSPAKAGLLAALRGVPYFLLVLPAGALVDRWDPRRVMIACDTGRALALASIPLTLALGHLMLWQLFVVTFIEGTLFVFFNQAESNCLVRVVSKDHLGAAVAQNEAIYGVSGLIGPGLGGLLYGLGRGVPFLTDAVSYLLSVAALLTLRTDVRPAPRADDHVPNLGAEIAEGLRWLYAHRVIRFVALLSGVMLASTAGYTLLLIVLAQRFGAGPATIGFLLATGGVGGIAGSLLAIPLQKRFRFGPLLIGASWVWTATWLLYTLAPSLVWLGVINVVNFLVVPVYLGTQYAYRLGQIPDALQGRVNSVFRLIAFGSIPVGLALTGWLLQKFGPVPTILITFAPQLLLCVAATFHPALRRATQETTP